ncbi:MAG: hypothetical protein GF344_15695 [Chitinivibrionales bacterium]|nr:hypothetical protein [Chitinivibrionales bacterium]MBD3358144.1 hypothetical protein [Chitinivibrionales bacterium]
MGLRRPKKGRATRYQLTATLLGVINIYITAWFLIEDYHTMPIRINAIGDSLLSDAPEGWLQQLAARYSHIEFVGESHPGWSTISFFKPHFSQKVFNRIVPPADAVIALAGSNDLFEDDGGGVASVRQATSGIKKLIVHMLERCPSAQAVIMAPPTVALCNQKEPQPRGGRCIHAQTPLWLAKLSESYRELAQNEGWTYINLFPLLQDSDFIDTAHPNEKGHAKIATAVETALSDFLSSTQK